MERGLRGKVLTTVVEPGVSKNQTGSNKDNLPVDQTWRRNMPPVHVIIKYI